jgi:peptidoglycan/LPS O-acetylase OafA/YrhL
VLSGFLITSILLSTRGASNYFSAFYARRALRIFPLAFFAIAMLYWVALPVLHRHGQLPKLPESEQVWYWLFLGNWRQGLGFNDGAELGHFWTLAIEEQFYLVFAVAARYLDGRRLAFLCIALALSSILLRVLVVVTGHGHNLEIWRLTILQLDPIALGALLACSGRFLAWSSRWRWPLMIIGITGLFVPLPPGTTILAGGIAATGLVAMAATRSVPFLRNRTLVNCGKYSYAMYVLHPFWLVGHIAKHHPHSMGLILCSLIAGPVISYWIAVLSWNVLEKQFLRFKKNFPYHFAPKGATPEEIIVLPMSG